MLSAFLTVEWASVFFADLIKSLTKLPELDEKEKPSPRRPVLAFRLNLPTRPTNLSRTASALTQSLQLVLLELAQRSGAPLLRGEPGPSVITTTEIIVQKTLRPLEAPSPQLAAL
ncbi:hypothetical protein P7C70_g4777, partial [Phenoliferia sp. Uapishka_3]